MSKTIKAGIVFSFGPTDEHEDLFNPEMTQDEILEYCRQLSWDDIISAVSNGYYNEVNAWVDETEGLTKCETCPTHAPEDQMTQIEGFSGRFVCEWCWINNDPNEEKDNGN